MDLEDVKTINLRDFVTQELGPPLYNRKLYSKWRCPFHADNDPSFTVFEKDNGWYCYGCDLHGDIINFVEQRFVVDFKQALGILTKGLSAMTPEQIEAMRNRHEQQAKEAKELAAQKRARAAILMDEAAELDAWASSLLDNESAIRFLQSKGVSIGIAEYFGLGFHEGHYNGPAISIPWRFHENLRAVQYRFLADGGPYADRYLWEPNGTPTLFNADIIEAGDKDAPLIITEGAIKSLVCIQEGFDACALPTKNSWQSGWGKHFRHRDVFVCLDPDAGQQSQSIAKEISEGVGRRARSVNLPAKIDDLLVLYGWGRNDLWHAMRHSVNEEG